MFGANITSIEQVGQIVEGWTNDLLGREQELSDKRMAICRECPLYNEKTDRCDGKRGINTKTGELVQYPGPDIIMGCNCYCLRKTKSKRAKCVLGKW